MIHKKIIIGITGASGAIYGIRLLEILKELDIETYLIISKAAHLTIISETKYKIEDVKHLASFVYNIMDIGANIASGSFKTDGMIIAPCSMRTMSAIACSLEDNLITRTAGVILKERRKLILMPRETPLHTGHLENMLKISTYGGIISPPNPAFYSNPQNINDIINHSITRILDLFDLNACLIKRWNGIYSTTSKN